MPKLSIEERANVVVLADQGHKIRDIAIRVGCSHTAVIKILRKKAETGSVERKKGSGRPRKTTIVEDNFLCLNSKRHRFKTASAIRNDLVHMRGTEVSVRTIRRRLVEGGLYARKSAQKPILNTATKKKRLIWAREHVNWTEEMWDRVIFSDESKFKLHVGDGRIIVRRSKGERLSDQCIQQIPCKTEGVMVWGCFCGHGLGQLAIIEHRATADSYLEILENHLKPSILELFSENGNFIFQQDNAPIHTAKKVIFLCIITIALLALRKHKNFIKLTTKFCFPLRLGEGLPIGKLHRCHELATIQSRFESNRKYLVNNEATD